MKPRITSTNTEPLCKVKQVGLPQKSLTVKRTGSAAEIKIQRVLLLITVENTNCTQNGPRISTMRIRNVTGQDKLSFISQNLKSKKIPMLC
jgi:hypothetical protein